MTRLDYYVAAYYDMLEPSKRVTAYHEISSFHALLTNWLELAELLSNNQTVRQLLLPELATDYSELFLNWIKVLAEDRYLTSFQRVDQLYLQLLMKDGLYYLIEVASPQALSLKFKQELVNLFKQSYGQDLMINYEIEPELLLGLKISINHEVVDLSALSQLKHLASEVVK